MLQNAKRCFSLLLFCIFFIFSTNAFSQIGSPFDLRSRLDTNKVLINNEILPEQLVNVPQTQKRNPFDLKRNQKDLEEVPIQNEIILLPKPDVQTTSKVSRSTFNAIWCLGLLLLLAITIVLQGGPIRKMFSAAFNANILGKIQREQRKFGYVIWAMLGLICLGSFIFGASRHLYPNLLDYSAINLAWFAGIAIFLLAVKWLVLQILKVIFPLERPVENYQLLIIVYAGVLGLCLFPALVLICFASEGLATAVAYLGIFIAASGYLFRSLRALINVARYIAGYPFHFLLYLCALEIGPLAVAFKLLTS